MALPKFIITMDGVFRLGMVNQHKDLLEHGDVLQACACEHSVSRESCYGHPCRSRTPLDGHCRNGLCCSESTLQMSNCQPSKPQGDRSGRVNPCIIAAPYQWALNVS